MSDNADMKSEKINELRKIVEESDNIVFFGGAGVSTESGIQILEVWMDCIIRSTNIHQRQ